MTFIIGPFVAFLATCLLIMVLRPIAIATHLVDVPNARSSHQQPTPLVGGVAIFLAVLVAYGIPATMGLVPIDRVYGSFFLAGLLLVIVGVVDDHTPLSSAVRFSAQIVAALLMIFGADVVLVDLGAMSLSGEPVYLGVMSVPFTVFATLGVINALNMSDGVDGLSGTLTLVSISGLLIAALFSGTSTQAFILTLMAAAIVGFLLFNLRIPGRKRASVFMGDAGSMFLGFALTWFAISLSQGGAERVITPASALWFLMLPIFDTVAMIGRRLLRRRSPFKADNEHIHHVFLMAGFTVNETIAVMAGAAMIGAGVGILSLDLRAPEYSVAGLFLIAGLLYLWMVMRSWKVMRFIERSICRRDLDNRRDGGDRRVSSDPDYSGPERRVTKRRLGERRVQNGSARSVSADQIHGGADAALED